MAGSDVSTCKNCDRQTDSDMIHEKTGYCEDCHSAYEVGFKKGMKKSTTKKVTKKNTKIKK